MPLNPGATLGSYTVTAKIGEGGTGEVYQARDTKLDRDVALKVLPEAFTSDPDRLARFEREAKVLASLNHPNIGGIHGLEDSGDVRALVLELVEGPTLADRIKQGPIPADEALPIVKQIAEALEAAHEAGVIHRDLKPANIKVREDGTVKVLDFGLAKAFQPDASDPNMSMSPTISLTAAVTQMGVIMGTAAYMSPEQARGTPVDKRADIWAFGCILYEMLTGRQVFTGELMSDVMASVLKSEPNYQGLPPTTPPRLRVLLERCLEKDPRQRWHDVGDVRIELTHAGEEPRDGVSIAAGTVPSRSRATVGWSAGVALALVAGWFAAVQFAALGDAPPWAGELVRFTFGPPPGMIFDASVGQPFEVSPDGRMVAFVVINPDGAPEIWVRDLNSDNARQVPGTEGAWSPFWSPDSSQIGFYAPGALKRVSPSGGDPVTITNEVRSVFPATTGAWGSDGTIILHLLTSKWVGVKDFGSQNGVEEEVDAVQCPRSRDTASR